MPRLSGGLTLVFQGGKPTIQKDTTIAGNVETIITVPTGKRWQLLSLMVTLVTDATVVNRFPSETQRDVADVAKSFIAASACTASDTWYRYWIQGLSTVAAEVNGFGKGILSAGEDLRISVSGGVVGDSYDYLVEYLEIDA